MKRQKTGFTSLALSFLFIHGAYAQSTAEVVQSFPIETTLQVPGVALTQQVWLDIVNSATRTLDIEQYYINNSPGQSLDPIMDAIKAAAARGVKVRFILDSAFLKKNSNEADSVQNIPNIDLREIDFSPGIMHAKYMVADGLNAYTGSANMDWLALSHIHEMGIHTVDAGIAADLESIFSTDWPNATEMSGSSSGVLTEAAKKADFDRMIADTSSGLPGLTVVASPKKANPAAIGDTLDAVTTLMANAKTSIDVQVYEYTTVPFSGKGANFTALDDVLREAAKRGVKVRLMVDATVMNAKSKTCLLALSKLPNVEIKAITIPQWSGGPLQYARLIHSKYFVIDGGSAGWVGSENWQDSYFLNTRNVGIVVADPSLATTLQALYTNVWDSAYGVALK